VAVAFPIRVKGGRLVGDTNVLDELRDNLVIPGLVDKLRKIGPIGCGGTQTTAPRMGVIGRTKATLTRTDSEL